MFTAEKYRITDLGKESRLYMGPLESACLHEATVDHLDQGAAFMMALMEKPVLTVSVTDTFTKKHEVKDWEQKQCLTYLSTTPSTSSIVHALMLSKQHEGVECLCLYMIMSVCNARADD